MVATSKIIQQFTFILVAGVMLHFCDETVT